MLEAYGRQGWWPVTQSGAAGPTYCGGPKTDQQRFEVMVGAILTQNTAWSNVEKAILNLQQSRLLSLAALKRVPLSTLAKKIRPSGYFNQKARKLKHLVQFLTGTSIATLRRSPALQLRGRLLMLWGIGPETADSILLYALNKPYFVVDAYTKRIASRLGLCEQGISYNCLQAIFQQQLPARVRLYSEYHALLVKHGKEVCRPRPHCGQCVLSRVCQRCIC